MIELHVPKRFKEAEKGPPTPQDIALKTLRYEDAEDGIPPVPVASVNPPKPPSSSTSASASLQEKLVALRPRTSPSPRIRTTVAADDVKRDSGIAPSVSTLDRAACTESQISSNAAGVAKEPYLPTISTHDDNTLAPVARSRSPFARKKSKDSLPTRKSSSASRSIQRMTNFQGLRSNIASGTLADIDLEDLASDKVGFSHRGSLLFGGKKMNERLKSQSSNGTGSDGITTPIANHAEKTPGTAKLPSDEPPKGGLTAGKRKPSIHMIQAALQGGRVLSAEEMTLSMKVRSMYGASDERAAEIMPPAQNGIVALDTAEGEVSGSSTPDQSIDGSVVGKTRNNKDIHPALRSTTPDVRASYVNKEAKELAGGIEDWEDVNGRDVDRYGFINVKRPTSQGSATCQIPGAGMQRVATSLQIESDQPRRNRKLRRGPSNATRTSRSVPPRTSEADTIRDGSLHSFQSGRSAGRMQGSNPFRSKTRKTVAEASDMLTLPPGLADIAEQEDSGRTASIVKRKEWERESKWQKMAQPSQQHKSGKGGGMSFEFDTNDQKLASRTWKGIPDRWRAPAWYSFLSASAKKRGTNVSEGELIAHFSKLQEVGSADDVQIDLDVPRTINLHIMFRRRYRGGQRLLFRVLHAISLYFPETGYVQGMASLAATLLCYFDEEKAFVMMVRLWQLRGLEQLFQTGFEGLMSALNEFEHDWLRGGDVAQKLDQLGINSTAYGTRWYLTLFNMSIPFPAQLRVWDVFMLLGDVPSGSSNAFGGADLDVLHATSAAIIDATREIILDSDFENAMKVLTSFVPIKDEDLLMRVARAEWKLRKKRGSA